MSRMCSLFHLLFSLLNQSFKVTNGLFLVPLSFNVLLSRVEDPPETKERHGIFCIVWSSFCNIIWHGDDMKRIDIKILWNFLAKLPDTFVFIGIFHVVIGDPYFINSSYDNELSDTVYKRNVSNNVLLLIENIYRLQNHFKLVMKVIITKRIAANPYFYLLKFKINQKK